LLYASGQADAKRRTRSRRDVDAETGREGFGPGRTPERSRQTLRIALGQVSRLRSSVRGRLPSRGDRGRSGIVRALAHARAPARSAVASRRRRDPPRGHRQPALRDRQRRVLPRPDRGSPGSLRSGDIGCGLVGGPGSRACRAVAAPRWKKTLPSSRRFLSRGWRSGGRSAPACGFDRRRVAWPWQTSSGTFALRCTRSHFVSVARPHARLFRARVFGACV